MQDLNRTSCRAFDVVCARDFKCRSSSFPSSWKRQSFLPLRQIGFSPLALRQFCFSLLPLRQLFGFSSPPDRLFMSSAPPDLPLPRLDPSAFVYGCESKWLVHFPCVVHCRDHALQLPSAVNTPATVDGPRRGSKCTQPHTSCTPQPSGNFLEYCRTSAHTRSAVHNPLRLCCASVNGICRPVHCDATTISIASRLALATSPVSGPLREASLPKKKRKLWRLPEPTRIALTAGEFRASDW